MRKLNNQEKIQETYHMKKEKDKPVEIIFNDGISQDVYTLKKRYADTVKEAIGIFSELREKKNGEEIGWIAEILAKLSKMH